ncbi:hypothetical protein D3C86_2140420 [compost metagenome]
MVVAATFLAELEVVVVLVLVGVAAATTGVGSFLIPTAMILSLVTVCTSLPIRVFETSSPS